MFGFAPPALSMPGRAVARRRKSILMLKLPLALVSMNITFSSAALLSPSSVETCLCWEAFGGAQREWTRERRKKHE